MIDEKVCPRKLGARIIIADNTPTVLLWILGAFLIFQVHWLLMVLFIIYIPFSVLWFWRFICTHCALYESKCCPCGYGSAAPKLFLFRDEKDFKKAFNKNIGIVFPYWFAPLFAGIYLLMYDYSDLTFIIFIAAMIDAFVVIPGVSRLVGCGSCASKDSCPWTEDHGKKKSFFH